MIDVNDLPKQERRAGTTSAPRPMEESFCSLKEMKKRYAQEVVERLSNTTRASEILGVSRTTLYRLLAESKKDVIVQKPTEHWRSAAKSVKVD
jgi:transcriptional regulator with PAS, ATPase and Fis domain